MRPVRRGFALAAVALLLATGSSAARGVSHVRHAPRVPHVRHVHGLTPFVVIPERRQPRLLHQRNVPLMPLPPSGGFVDPGGPLPSGFTMTLVRGAEPAPAADAELARPREIARRLAACWSPPNFDGPPAEITLRLQFSKAGRVIGEPKVTYVAAPGDQRSAVVTSMQAALKDCTPLRFTASLGAGIAGYPFAIRFIADRRKPDDQQ